MQQSRKDLCEFGIGYGIRCRAVQCTRNDVVLRCPPEHPQQIVAMNPGHPLLAVSQLAPNALTKRREHLFECSSAGSQNNADPNGCYAETNFASTFRFALPGDT